MYEWGVPSGMSVYKIKPAPEIFLMCFPDSRAAENKHFKRLDVCGRAYLFHLRGWGSQNWEHTVNLAALAADDIQLCQSRTLVDHMTC